MGPSYPESPWLPDWPFCLPLTWLRVAPVGAGGGRPVCKLRCALLLGTRRAFLQQLGMSGGWGRAGLAGWGQGQCLLPQPPLPTLGRELTPHSPAHPPPLPSSLEILRENSSGLAVSPVSQLLEEAPQNFQCLQWIGDMLEPRARSVPWDGLRPDWGGMPFQKCDQFCLLVAYIRLCLPYLVKNPTRHLGVFLSVSDAKHLRVYAGAMSDIPAAAAKTGSLGHLSSKETPEYCPGQSLPNIGPGSVCCPLLVQCSGTGEGGEWPNALAAAGSHRGRGRLAILPGTPCPPPSGPTPWLVAKP